MGRLGEGAATLSGGAKFAKPFTNKDTKAHAGKTLQLKRI